VSLELPSRKEEEEVNGSRGFIGGGSFCFAPNEDDLEKEAWEGEQDDSIMSQQPVKASDDKEEDYHAHKFDQGKTDYSLIPYEVLVDLYSSDSESLWSSAFRRLCEEISMESLTAIAGVRMVLEYGLEKYGQRDSWKNVPDGRNRYLSAMFRHLIDDKGEPYPDDHVDEESGLLSVNHALCNLCFLIWFDINE